MKLRSEGKQKTLKEEISLKGIGLFTGAKTEITLIPSQENSGIVFQRIDQPSAPLIPAHLEWVKETPRCTRLKRQETEIWTVEHLLSALSAYEIDNLLIQLNGPEVPVGDGSASFFAEAIEKSSVVEQKESRKVFYLKDPIFWSEKETHILGIPADEYRISYTLHYPHNSFLGTQYYSFSVNSEKYRKEIAPCRTFSLYEEIETLLNQGLLKEVGLENGVVIKNNKVLNPEGLRFSDEMVKHKILDLLGDCSLLGFSCKMHIIAIRSGHLSNIAFAKELQKCLE